MLFSRSARRQKFAFVFSKQLAGQCRGAERQGGRIAVNI
jgi:hypothetical protein